MYVDTNCIDEKINLQVGALPVTGIGLLGLSSSGWVDGIKAIYKENPNREWTATVGEVDEYDEPGVFKRHFDGPNMYKIDVTQKFQGGMTVVVAASQYNDEEYLRWIVEKTMTENRILQKVQLEQIFTGGKATCELARVTFKPIKRWLVQVGATYQDPDRAQDFKVVKYFYGAGKNYQLEAERPIANKTSLTFRVRDGDAGLFTDLGIYKQFSPKK